jgi:sulfonate transport system substrate-binding protein
MRISRRNVLRSVAAAGALSLAPSFGACGERSSQASSTGRKRVRLTYNIISVPRARGVFEQTLRAQGVDVTWLGPFPNHAPTLQAVASDTADFSFGGSSTPAAQAILSGSTKLVYVAWSTVTPRTTSIIVLPNAGIQRVQDLVGKTVAVNKAGVAEFLLVAALEKYGVPRDKVQVIYLNPPDAAPAFANGKVDAWAIWSGPLELAEVQHGAVRIFEEGKELDTPVDFGSYVVRREYAEREPETIRKVIQAYQAEYTWAATHAADAVAIANKLSKYPETVVEKLVGRYVNTHWSLMNDEGIAKLQHGIDWLAERKIISARLDVEQHSVRL